MTTVVTAIAEAEAGHPSPAGPSRYGRMFPGLAPLVTDPRLPARTTAAATAWARSAAASSRKS